MKNFMLTPSDLVG